MRLRLRSQGYWAIGIGVVGLVGCLIGIVEFWLYGEVSIRTGHEPASGDSAVQMLSFLGLLSMLFTAIGMFLVYRSRRESR